MPSRPFFTGRLARFLPGLALWVLAFPGWTADCAAQAPDPSPSEEEERILACIERLGADSWGERNGASLELVKAGPVAFEALFRASRHARDPEVRHQARLILTDNLWKGMPNYLAEEFLGFFQKGVAKRCEILQKLLYSPDLEKARLKTYLLRAFLYDPAPKVREDALDYLDRKGFLLDLKLLRQLARSRPEPAVARAVGLACSRNGFAEEAIRQLSLLVKGEAEDDPELRGALARSLAEAGRLKEAVPLAASVLAQGSSTAFDRTALALILIEGGEAGAFLDAHPWKQVGEDERLFLAATLEARGRHAEAAGLLGLGNPGAEGVLLARILARNGNGEEALRLLAGASDSLGPDGPTVLVQVRTLALRGFSEGVLDLLAPAEGGEVLPIVALERARILIDTGRPDEAAAQLESKAFLEGVRNAPPMTWRGASDLLSRAGKEEAVLRLLDSVSRPEEELPAWRDARVLALERLVKQDEALRFLVAVFPDVHNAPEHERLSRKILALARAGKGLEVLGRELEASMAEAERAWKRRARGRPKWLGLSDDRRSVVFALLGRVRALQGRPDKARTCLNRAWELAPHSLESLVTIDRIRLEEILDDALSEEFFRFLLEPSGRTASASIPPPEECVRFLWFAARACDARWEETVYPNYPPGPALRFYASLRALLPGPPVPFLMPAFPEFGAQLWRWRLGEPDAIFSDEVRIRGALSFAVTRGAKAQGLLLHLAREGEGSVRETAVNRLMTLEGAVPAEQLLHLMRRGIGDFDWQVRVARVLERGSVESVKDELERMAGDAKSRLRPVAAWLLLRSGKPGYEAVLEEEAGRAKTASEARRFACLALAPLSDESYRPLFKELLVSEYRELRMASAVALARLGGAEGRDAVVRELRWLFRNGDEDWACALEAASMVGGGEVARALVLGLQAGTIPRGDLLQTLGDLGGPDEGEWVRVLDLFPFLEAGSEGLLGPVLDALADFGSAGEAREGLACLRENTAPGAMSPEDLALAARLARRAGRDEEARAWFVRARAALFGREDTASREMMVKLLCDFGEQPPEALSEARALLSRHGPMPWAVSLNVRALRAAGRKDEAKQVLEEALSDLPLAGRAHLVRLRSRLFPE